MNNLNTEPGIEEDHGYYDEEDYEYYDEDLSDWEPTEAELEEIKAQKEERRKAYLEEIKNKDALSLKLLGCHVNSKPAPVAITHENYKDKSLSRQKWDFEVSPRKKHRAFYGSTLDCQAGTGCGNEPFYQVKWFSYKKTGKIDWAYGVKHNHKWACPTCTKKWAIRNLKDKDYELPELPAYPNPAHIPTKWDGPATIYDARFC